MSSKDDRPFSVEHSDRGVVTLTLERPDIHNAFDDRLIVTLTDALGIHRRERRRSVRSS